MDLKISESKRFLKLDSMFYDFFNVVIIKAFFLFSLKNILWTKSNISKFDFNSIDSIACQILLQNDKKEKLVLHILY